MLPNERQVYISARNWQEVSPKIKVTPFMYALYEGVDLHKYGDGIQKFYFTFLVQRSAFFKPAKFYSRKKKEADISIEIPYEEVVNATETETIQLMEAAYLKGIDQLATLKLVGDFDVKAFKKDVEAIFAKDKWYEQAVSV